MTSNVLANDMQLRKGASSISNCANRIRSGVELDQVFGSKWLLSCIPWVSQFHTTRLLCSNSPCCTKVYRGKIASDHCENSADNADSNIATINESGTLHRMGIIRWSRSNSNVPETRTRRRARITISDIVDQKGSELLRL